MSRHLIRDDRQFEVIVGWDPPLQTLFLQVYDKSRDEDLGPLVWRGCRPTTLSTICSGSYVHVGVGVAV